MNQNNKTTLFYTCVNTRFWSFGMIYPLFVLLTNPNSLVEIGVENILRFRRKYKPVIDFYNKNFPQRVRFNGVDFERWSWLGREKIVPNTVRFITQPVTKADYLYIGDADIFITEEIPSQHLANIEKYDLDFSNVVRTGKRRLTGLHFIEYDKMYPLPSFKGLDLKKKNDEEVLYELMDRKGYKMPPDTAQFRPQHGLHISMYSSAPFEFLEGLDDVIDFPAWFMSKNSRHNMGHQDIAADIEKYFALRKRPEFVEFVSGLVRKEDADMRRILQITDACAYYYKQVILPKQDGRG